MMKRKKYILYAALASITLYSCADINLLIFDAACVTGDINTEQGIILASLQPKKGEAENILFSKDGNIHHSFSPRANTLTDPVSKQLYIGGRYSFSSQENTYKDNMTLFSPIEVNVYTDYSAIDKEIGYAKALGNGLMGLISLDKKTVYIVSIYGDIIWTRSRKSTDEFKTFETTWSADNTYGLLAIGGKNIDDSGDGMLISLRQSKDNRCKYTAETSKIKTFSSVRSSDGTIVDMLFPIKKIKKFLSFSDNQWALLLLVDYGEDIGIAVERIAIAADTTETSDITLAEAAAKVYTLPTGAKNRIVLRAPVPDDPRPFSGDSMVLMSNDNYLGIVVLMQRNNKIYAMSHVIEQSKNTGGGVVSRNTPPSVQSIGENKFESFSSYMRVYDNVLVVGTIGYAGPTRFFSLLSFSVSAPTTLITDNSSLLQSTLIHFSKKSKSIPVNTDIEIKDFIYR